MAAVWAALDRAEREGPRLDYKLEFPADHVDGELAKDLSALANTEGGWLLYGVLEDAEGGPAATPGINDVVDRQPVDDWFQ